MWGRPAWDTSGVEDAPPNDEDEDPELAKLRKGWEPSPIPARFQTRTSQTCPMCAQVYANEAAIQRHIVSCKQKIDSRTGIDSPFDPSPAQFSHGAYGMYHSQSFTEGFGFQSSDDEFDFVAEADPNTFDPRRSFEEQWDEHRRKSTPAPRFSARYDRGSSRPAVEVNFTQEERRGQKSRAASRARARMEEDLKKMRQRQRGSAQAKAQARAHRTARSPTPSSSRGSPGRSSGGRGQRKEKEAQQRKEAEEQRRRAAETKRKADEAERSRAEEQRRARSLAQYEQRWAAFEASPPKNIRARDVPWPPVADDILAGVPGNDRKAKFRKAVSRWHPDKFKQKFGPHLHDDEAEAIMARVNEICVKVLL